MLECKLTLYQKTFEKLFGLYFEINKKNFIALSITSERQQLFDTISEIIECVYSKLQFCYDIGLNIL